MLGKRFSTIVLFLVFAVFGYAQSWISPSEHERQSEYYDNTFWEVYDKNGIVIKQMAEIIHDYGNYFRLTIFIANHSNEEIYIDPKMFEATYINRKGNMKDLYILSAEEYMERVYIRQEAIFNLNVVSHALSSGNAGDKTINGTSTTYYSDGSYRTTETTIHYHDAVAEQIAQERYQEKIAAMNNSFYNERKNKKKQLLNSMVLCPGQYTMGYVYIKRKARYKQMENDIIINDARYHFSWNWNFYY